MYIQDTKVRIHDVDKLVTKLIEAKKAYYEGNPTISDKLFDDLEEQLKQLDPDNSYFDIVGTPINGNKITHKYPMLSMGKAKSVEGVIEWLNKISDKRLELLIEPKIDGLSCSIVYEDGVISYISTRGDGTEGQDITHIKDYIDIPKNLECSSKRVEVRGELYLPKDTKFPNLENKPLRNLAVGLINRKSEREDIKYLRFISYNIIYSNASFTYEESKICDLKLHGFDIVWYKTIASKKELHEIYNVYLSNMRDNWKYETDGLVITVNVCSLHEEINEQYTISHHNWFNIALKPPSEAKETILSNIEWNMSRLGYLIPVGILNPINIGGSTISRVSLHNYKTVIDFGLKYGDKVLIEKANDVIPYFKEVISHSNSDDDVFPRRCNSCGTLLEHEGVHLICRNHKSCPDQQIEKVIYWVKESGMDGMSDSTVRSLFNEGKIQSIQNLYFLTEDMLQGIEGFGDKKIANIIAQIEKSKTMTISQFISKLGIELVGEKAVKKLGIETLDQFLNFDYSTYKVGQNIIDFKKKYADFIYQLTLILTIEDVKQVVNSKGNVTMTGPGPKGRKELIKDIEDGGYTFLSSVTKDVDILICYDINGGSSKLVKAKKLGIKIMSYEDFFN